MTFTYIHICTGFKAQCWGHMVRKTVCTYRIHGKEAK